MFVVVDCFIGDEKLFGVLDTSDGVVEYYSYDSIRKILSSGIAIENTKYVSAKTFWKPLHRIKDYRYIFGNVLFDQDFEGTYLSPSGKGTMINKKEFYRICKGMDIYDIVEERMVKLTDRSMLHSTVGIDYKSTPDLNCYGVSLEGLNGIKFYCQGEDVDDNYIVVLSNGIVRVSIDGVVCYYKLDLALDTRLSSFRFQINSEGYYEILCTTAPLDDGVIVYSLDDLEFICRES